MSCCRTTARRSSWLSSGWYSTWSASSGAISSARASIPAGKFETPAWRISSRSCSVAQRAEAALERDLGDRPVQQQQVDVVGPEPPQRLLRRRRQRRRLVLAVPDLRRQPDVAAVHAARRDPGADLRLVLVRPRGVDVPVADLERVLHALGRVLPGHLPRPVPEPRDRGPLHGEDEVVVGARVHAPNVPVSEAPDTRRRRCYACDLPGRLAQLGERLLDKQEVTGSSPVSPIERPAFCGPFVSVGCDRDRGHGCHRIAPCRSR